MFDPIKLEVYRNIFISITDEMGTLLKLSSFSPNIKERRDYSAALFSERAEIFALGAHIPVHLGAMPSSVEAALKEVELGEGDTALLNHPFYGGTHLPDITLISPVFWEGSPAFYVANRAHHSDVGGMQPGSMPLAEEIYQEGLIIPPVKIEEKGKVNRDILKLIAANSRNPEEREADLMAQIAANRKAIHRLQELLERKGEEAVEYAYHIVDYSERILRKRISELPSGKFYFQDFMDDDGFGSQAIEIKVCLWKEGQNLVIDFAGTSPQVRGGINANSAITLSAVLYSVKLMLGEDLPINSGLLRPVKVKIPPGSLLNPYPPAAVAGGNVETSQRIVDVVLGAFSMMLPHRAVAASQGTMNNISFGGRDFAYYETIGGGAGATPESHGASGLHTHMTNSMNTPVEVLEREFLVLIRRYELRKGSGGRGRRRGGDGIVREYEFLSPARVSILSERRRFSPYGLEGGQGGKPGRNLLVKKGKVKVLPSKINFKVGKGDRLVVETPGGGGFGKED